MIRALDPKLNPASAEIQALKNQLTEKEKKISSLEVSSLHPTKALNLQAGFFLLHWMTEDNGYRIDQCLYLQMLASSYVLILSSQSKEVVVHEHTVYGCYTEGLPLDSY